MWQPENVEFGLHGLSLARLGTALLGPALQGQRGPGAGLHFVCMVVLAVLTSVLDRCGSKWFTDHPLYAFRLCSQAGLTQGLLALPSLATAIFIATRSWWWQQAARLFVASSFQVLLWLAWTAASSRGPKTSSGAHHTTDTAALKGLRPIFPRCSAAATRLFLAAAAVGSLLSAASALLHATAPPPPSSPHLLLPGSVFELPYDIRGSAWVLQGALLLVSVPGLDHLAADLPRSFTPGEMGILLQALLALLAGSAAYIAGAVRQGALHVLWCPHVVQPDPGMHVPAFCMLVLFWVLLLAACCTLALAGPRGGSVGADGRGAKGRRDTRRGAGSGAVAPREAVVVAAVDGGPGSMPGRVATADSLKQRPARSAAPESSAPRAGGVAAETLSATQPGDKGSHAGDSGPAQGLEVAPRLDVLLGTAARAVAAAGAVLSFGMLVDLALWVLGRFVAASSQPRLATLAYWFSCLAVAVPFMFAVSKASAAREQQPARLERQPGRVGAGSEGPAGPSHRQGLAGLLREEEGAAAEAGTAVRAGMGQGRAGAAASGCGQAAEPRLPAVARGEAPRESERAAGHAAAAAGAAGAPGEVAAAGTARTRWEALAAALLRALAVPHIVMRKGYHLLAILLFLPAFRWDVRMLQASLAVAGAVLVFVELLRCRGPAPVRAAIGGFMADFADSRDSGPIYVTHFTLLLGIAVPVWLCEPVCGAAAGAMMAGLYGSEAAEPMPMPPNAGPLAPPLSAAAARLLPSCRTILGLSGLVSLGSGDTAAACVGFLLGRWRLFRGGKKTWEGTLSGAAAMLASWAVVVWWLDLRWALGWHDWGALAAVTAGVSLLEAVTQQLDNVVVPLYYLTHLVLTMTGN